MRAASRVQDAGQPVNTKDVNDVISKNIYSDPLDRPTQIVANVGTALERQSTIIYDDTNRRVETKTDLNALNDNLIKSESFYDGLGRTIESRSYKDGGYVATKTEYDPLGRVKRVTNPLRPLLSEPELWTETTYDALGRAIKVKSPDNAEVNTAYSGNAVTVTDQAGKLRRSITNALGQLTRIDEPNSSNVLGNLATPNQPTYYHYNTLGKLVRVQQGDQNRYFMYDSLGRLLRVRQPEQIVNTALNTSGNPDNNSWTAGFTYDNNGNALTATDAKGTTITNTYDELNRVGTRSYNDSPQTPTVNFYYDGAGLPSVPANSKGKLTKVTSSVSESRYTQFDLLGRNLEYKQITDGQTYTSSYQYNFAGALIQETYPSGRVVQNAFDQDGELSRIYGKANSTATERTYANAFSYTPDGRIEKLRLGNLLWEAAKFNNRLQVTEFSLGRGVSSGDVWKNSYEYGELQGNGTVDATKNSGNIGKQTITFAGLANPLVQTYKYDPLYRLTEAKETANGAQTWKQVFDYDRYGNRTTYDKWLGTTAQTLTTAEEPIIDNTTNRISSPGYTFDANGNLIIDAEGRQFTFNGDNKQTKVRESLNNTIGDYVYDGEGKRIKKVVGNNTTVFVYSGTKLIAEYSTETPPSNPTTSWTVTDQLGSPRVIVNALAEVVSRRDFMPFGEELDADGTYRTTGQKYGQTDGVRQKFTGYQKDEETGLDFAEARMYQNLHGRFTAIDPLLSSGKSANPQTFNRYVYVGNNPVLRIDPDGEDWIVAISREKMGNREVDVRRPVWIPKGEISSDIPRASSIWEINIGGNGFQALDPNRERASEIFKTRQEAQDWYNANVADERVNSLVDSIGTNPMAVAADRVTNPDGVQVGVQGPFGISGASVWLTRDFDYGYSTSFGATPTDFTAGMRDPNFNPFSARNLLGGVSASATYIAGQSNTDPNGQESRTSFFVGRSVNVSACYYFCAGGTRTDPGATTPARYSFNPGIGSPSLNANVSEGVCVGNVWRESGCPR